MQDSNRTDFLVAMGETFSEHVSPPIDRDEATPHECCEAVWSLLGTDVAPRDLAALGKDGILALCAAFGDHFACEAPEPECIERAIAATLCRWPVGSLNRE